MARRTDGLGGRLVALLNGLRLARLLDVPLRFAWPSDSNLGFGMTIPEAGDVFSERFLDAYLGDTPQGYRYSTLGSTSTTLEELSEKLDHRRMAIMPIVPLWTFVSDEAARGPFRSELDQIEFTESFAAAIAAADAIPIEHDFTAIHVRAGDIVFGSSRRHFVHTRKAIAYPAVDRLAREIRASGATPVLFGQERDALERIARSHGAVLAEDLLPAGIAGLPRALAEIVLMSRMPRIVATDSVFARAAAALADQAVVDPATIVPASEQAAACDADAEHWPPLAAAYAHFYAYYLTRHEAPAEDSLRRVRSAASADPLNPLHPIIEASLLEGLGRGAEAETVLASALVTDYPEELGDVVSTMGLRYGKRQLLAEFVDPIMRLARDGHPSAIVVAEALPAAEGDQQ